MQTQAPKHEDQPQQIATVGFEDALNKLLPGWQNTLPQEQIEIHRAFYAKGVNDAAVFANVAVSDLQQGHTFLAGSIRMTAVPAAPKEPGKPAPKKAKAPAKPVAAKKPVKTAAKKK